MVENENKMKLKDKPDPKDRGEEEEAMTLIGRGQEDTSSDDDDKVMGSFEIESWRKDSVSMGSDETQMENRTIQNLIQINTFELLKLAIPIACTALFTRTMTATDLIVIGHFLDREGVAGVALGNTLYNMFYFFIIGMATSITTMCSQAHGARSFEDVVQSAQRGFIILIVSALPIMILLACIPEWILVHLMRQNPNVATLAAIYVRILLLGLPATIAFDVLVIFLQSQEITMPYLYVSVVTSVCNIGLDLSLISSMGLTGAPIATVLCQYLRLMLLSIYVYITGLHKNGDSFPGWQWQKIFEKTSTVKMLRMALFGGLMLCSEAVSFEISTIFVGMLNSELSLNSHFIMLNFIGLMYQIFPMSIAIACNVRIGNLIGMRLQKSTKITAYLSICLGGISMLISALVCLFKRTAIGVMYSSDREVIEVIAELSEIAAVFQVADGIQSGAVGVLRGLGRQRIAAIITIFGFTLLGASSGFVFCFSFGYGLQGIWVGFNVGVISAALLSCIAIMRTDWTSAMSFEKANDRKLYIRDSTTYEELSTDETL